MNSVRGPDVLEDRLRSQGSKTNATSSLQNASATGELHLAPFLRSHWFDASSRPHWFPGPAGTYVLVGCRAASHKIKSTAENPPPDQNQPSRPKTRRHSQNAAGTVRYQEGQYPIRSRCLRALIDLNCSSSRSAGGRTPRVRLSSLELTRRTPGRTLPVRGARLLTFATRSGSDQEEQEGEPVQVQGPVPAPPVHARPQGCREGREAEAEPTTLYATRDHRPRRTWRSSELIADVLFLCARSPQDQGRRRQEGQEELKVESRHRI